MEELLTGKMGDTDTARIVKVMVRMKRFAEKDTNKPLLLVLTLNVLDKGFRNVVVAREQGSDVSNHALPEAPRSLRAS